MLRKVTQSLTLVPESLERHKQRKVDTSFIKYNHREEDNIKNIRGGCELDSSYSVQGPVAGSCEHKGNDLRVL
jgi:hypothetical protein